VRTNFRMPDVLACGLGGGSLVDGGPADVRIGPKSLGYRLNCSALVFGGDTLCATDIAVAAGYARIGEPSRVQHLPRELVSAAVARMHAMLAEGVDRMKTSAAALPLVLVGGGSILVRDRIPGVSETIVPPHAEVANAIGAAIAQVSGEVDQVFAYERITREDAIRAATREAQARAIEAGADPATLQTLDMDELPLAYMPGSATRIRVKVAGDLALQERT